MIQLQGHLAIGFRYMPGFYYGVDGSASVLEYDLEGWIIGC